MGPQRHASFCWKLTWDRTDDAKGYTLDGETVPSCWEHQSRAGVTDYNWQELLDLSVAFEDSCLTSYVET